MSESPTVSAAAELGEMLRTHADQIEQERGLPDEVVDELVEAGLMRFWVPASLGGGETSAASGVQTIIEVARHDGGAAWCVMIANTTGLLAGFLGRSVADQRFGAQTAIGGGFAQPVGRCRVVDGGLEVSGRWPWGSGAGHCTTIGGGTLLVDDSGSVAPRADGLTAPFVFFDPSQVEIIDTWHTLGLAGSGSNDYAVERAFVPEGHWVEIGRTAAVESGPLYRFSLFGLLAAGVAGVAIGLASRALDDFVELASAKTPQGSQRLLSDRASTQALAADAEAIVQGSTRLLLGALTDAWEADDLGLDERQAIRLAATDATRRCVDAVVDLYRASGGEAVYRRSPMERTLRDVLVVGQHAMVADRTRELLGRLRLGMPADTTQL